MELDLRQALHYLGAGEQVPPALLEQVSHQAGQLQAALRPRYVYRVYDITRTGQGLCLSQAGLVLPGNTAGRMLEECGRAALLACTLGAEYDAMLRTCQARDMAQAVILDACGSAWVEAGCDAAEAELAGLFPGLHRTDRFSPGYGDLPLELQAPLCAALDAQRRIGLTVTPSFLLNPTKSVTAVIGLAAVPQKKRIRGCAYCSMRQTCSLRKRVTTCAL